MTIFNKRMGNMMALAALLVLAWAPAAFGAKGSAIPAKLEGNYVLLNKVYIANAKRQAGGVPSGDSVTVFSAGITSTNMNDVLAAGGIQGDLTFDTGFKVPSTLLNEGTMTGTLKTDSQSILITGATYAATLSYAGLRLVVQWHGTPLLLGLGSSGGAAALKPSVAARPKAVYGTITILLRKSVEKK